MGYRLPPRPEVRHHYDATAEKSTISVDNGTIAHLAIPCFYWHGQVLTRDYVMRVDHAGWPSPDSVDMSWQLWDVPDDGIHLEDEGYTQVEVVLASDAPAGLSATGSIDVNVVRVAITAECQDALTEDVETAFSIHVTGEGLDDIITKGTLRVVAGPLG
jgi:hypothetical protein